MSSRMLTEGQQAVVIYRSWVCAHLIWTVLSVKHWSIKLVPHKNLFHSISRIAPMIRAGFYFMLQFIHFSLDKMIYDRLSSHAPSTESKDTKTVVTDIDKQTKVAP